MNQAKAFANNDVVLLVWDYENPIDDCLGFCIKRKNINTNKEVTLESMVGFKRKVLKPDNLSQQQFGPFRNLIGVISLPKVVQLMNTPLFR